MTVDIIIHGGFVVTMEGKGTGIIPDGAVCIKENRIAAVGESKEILSLNTKHLVYQCMQVYLYQFDIYLSSLNQIQSQMHKK